MERPMPPCGVPTITVGLDTGAGVTQDTTTSLAGLSPKVRWTCSAVTVSALAACCHRTGLLATTRPPAVTPMPPMNDRRERPTRSMLSVITVLPGGTQTKQSNASGPEGREAKPTVYSRLTVY